MQFEQVKATMNSQISSNGFPHRRVEKEAGVNKAQPVKPHSVKNTGFVYIFVDIYYIHVYLYSDLASTSQPAFSCLLIHMCREWWGSWKCG